MSAPVARARRRRPGLARRAGFALALGLSAAGGGAPLGERTALAQGAAPELSLKADADEIEVGEAVNLTLSAMSESTAPQPGDPQLKVPAGFSATGPVISTQSQMSIVNGRISQRSGLRASWQLSPSAAGTFDIGPVTVVVGGRRVSVGSVRVVVRPSGGRPHNRGRRQGGFDPFGGLFGPSPFAIDDDPKRQADSAPEPPADPQLALEAAAEPSAFLRAVVDKPRVVVGEQVTLSVYMYTQPRVYQVLDPHEPPAVDFYQRVVATGADAELHAVNVGGARWTAQLIRRVALFPLKAGDLAVGPMSVTLLGPGFRGGGMRGGLLRSSRPMTVQVTEPPGAGRPAGYQIGDVGAYTLTASVEPRAVRAGGSVAVTALLRGTGNVPAALRLPERRGVSFLEPEVRESIDTPNGVVAGSRSFVYIVKITEQGAVDLGSIALPYWNPKTSQYQVAQASLGVVQVSPPSEPAAPEVAGPVDPLAALAPRASLRPFVAPRPPLTDAPWFWLALVGGPASVLLVDGAARVLRKAKGARERVRSSSAARVRQALAEADAAGAARDGRTAASAVERALVLAVESATGLRLRGLLREEVRPALERQGLAAEVAEEVASILRALDAWRVEPGAAPEGAPPIERARRLVKRLPKGSRLP